MSYTPTSWVNGATALNATHLNKIETALESTTALAEAAAALAVTTGFNVMDPAYGAVGDGVIDDLVAIQNAINAAHALYVSTGVQQDVIIPQGLFKVGWTNYIKGNGSTYGITSLVLLDGEPSSRRAPLHCRQQHPRRPGWMFGSFGTPPPRHGAVWPWRNTESRNGRRCGRCCLALVP